MSHSERVLRNVEICAGRTNFMWLKQDAWKKLRLCFGDQGSVDYEFPGVREIVAKLESSGEFRIRRRSAFVCWGWDRNRNTRQ
ncbi:hypothetical protein LCGC14_1498830 [marine sediment metagenome]|uniref:Uncharacterized protein n=1 Tax=marine sediment metagenome TaxID=412755 RepID=A0A0F9J4N1_9ZZZZ